jgi:tungstate transport system substrate-binding protein
VAQPPSVTVAATTSFTDSRIAAALIPAFSAATGIEVDIISRGSEEDLYLAQKGVVDVVLVNNPDAVARFAKAGYVDAARAFMANKFILAGPASDPAGVAGSRDRGEALKAIARERATFVSRADNSGTHEAEQRLWASAGVRPRLRAGNWYREIGLGMAETLQHAARVEAYVFTDRASWLASPARTSLPAVVEAAEGLDNRYEVMMVSAKHNPAVKAREAAAFIDWLTSSAGQSAIAAYTIDGEQAFFPTARPGS